MTVDYGRERLLDGLELAARDLARPVREHSHGIRQKLGIILAVSIAAYAVEFLGAIWPDLAAPS